MMGSSPSPSSPTLSRQQKQQQQKNSAQQLCRRTFPALVFLLVLGGKTQASPVGIGSRGTRNRRATSNSDSGRRSSLNLPIPNLAESLAASAARSTIVALSSSSLFCGSHGDDEFVLLVCRSPRNQNKNRAADGVAKTKDDDHDEEGVDRTNENATWESFLESLQPKGGTTAKANERDGGAQEDEDGGDDVSKLLVANADLTTKAPIWILQGDSSKDLQQQLGGPPLVAAFTGFAPDIAHLVKRVAQSLWNTAIGTTYSRRIPVKTVVQDHLAPPLVQAAARGGGRPFGVQSLVVGSAATPPALLVYTVDPSGGWRHWGSGVTAIGHQAAMVRHSLHRLAEKRKKLQRDEQQEAASDKAGGNDTQRARKVQTALEQAMKALVETFSSKEKKKGAQNGDDDEEDSYSAMIVFCQPQTPFSSSADDDVAGSCCWTLDKAALSRAYQKCRQEMQ